MDNESCSSGGYRLHFVDEVSENLLCIFCHFPSRDPQLSTCCGYNMCRGCLDGHKQLVTMGQKILSCPKCCYYDFKVYPNKMSDRQIHNLVVLCSNGKAGCKWRGKLNELNGHLEYACQYEIVECPKGCEVSLPRRDIAPHVKLECSRLVINCPHCLVRGEKLFIEGRHLEECANLPLNCPNHCGATISDTEALSKHKDICPLEIVSCEYNDLGCNTDMARRDVEAHNRENLTKHLNLAKQKLVCSTKELESSKTQLAMVEKELHTFKATFACNIEEVLTMITLLGQLDLVQRNEEKSNLLRQIILYHRNLLSIQGNKVAPVILKMNKFANYRRNGMMWYSAPFFTHRHGYKLCLCVFAAARDKDVQEGNHVSVYVAVMEGPYDAQLAWPMEGAIHISLLNQLCSESVDLNYSMTINLPDTPLFPFSSTMRITQEDKKSSVKTPKGMMSSTGIGTNKFVPLDKLTEVSPYCQFLKNDCIFFKVTYDRKLGSVSPKSCVYKNQEGKSVKQSYHIVPLVLNKTELPVNNLQSSYASGVTRVPKESQQTPKIPEADTKL